jgi:hypothetical protein
MLELQGDDLYCSPLRDEAWDQRTRWLTIKEVSPASKTMGRHNHGHDGASRPAGSAGGRNLSRAAEEPLPG